MRYLGIDYGLVNPAITVLNEDGIFENGNSYFLTNTKKYASSFKNMIGTLHLPYNNNIQRYENIALWALKLAKPDDICYIEDYSLGSVGKVFNLAECTGILKYIFLLHKINLIPVPPSQIKKFATGKGNATKDAMYESFIDAGNPNLYDYSGLDHISSPFSDIVDSYWIARYAKAKTTNV